MKPKLTLLREARALDGGQLTPLTLKLVEADPTYQVVGSTSRVTLWGRQS